MHYRIGFNDDISDEKVDEIYHDLIKIVQEHESLDKTKDGWFLQEGKTIVLINQVWGINRPEVYDVEELSEKHPDVVFYVTRVSEVLNTTHFEPLKNYSLSEYRNGALVSISEPEPIKWVTVREFRRLNPWG